MRILIPARLGSKGLPLKNRKLFRNTADIISNDLSPYVDVLTNDSEIAKMTAKYGFRHVTRSSGISRDITSTKETIQWYLQKTSYWNENIIMLYLTYPGRKWRYVEKAFNLFKELEAESLLCKKTAKTSPFLMLKSESGMKGSQLFYHDLYRRQDYPKCFEISHYISIFKGDVINKLNNNLYNRDTIFMEIPSDVIDVDTQKDLDLYNEQGKD